MQIRKYLKALLCFEKKEEKHLILNLALDLIREDPLNSLAEKVFNQFTFNNINQHIYLEMNVDQLWSIIQAEWKCIERCHTLGSPWRLITKCLLFACKKFDQANLKLLINHFTDFVVPSFEMLGMGEILIEDLKTEHGTKKIRAQNMLLVLALLEQYLEEDLDSLRKTLWPNDSPMWSALNAIMHC